MILSCGESQNGGAVSDRQNAGFLAKQSLFDDELITGFAELAPPGNAIDRVERITLDIANDDALSCRQSVCLHDHGHGVVGIGITIFDIASRIVSAAKCLVAGGRNVRGVKQVFAKNFTAFQFGCCGRRSKYENSSRLKRIDEASDQRCFGANDDKINRLLFGKPHQCHVVGGGNRHVSRFGCSSGVAWRDKNLCYTWALRYFPTQCVLPTTRSNDKNFHY